MQRQEKSNQLQQQSNQSSPIQPKPNVLQNLSNQTPNFNDNMQMQQDNIDIANAVYNPNGTQNFIQQSPKKFQSPITSVDYNV